MFDRVSGVRFGVEESVGEAQWQLKAYSLATAIQNKIIWDEYSTGHQTIILGLYILLDQWSYWSPTGLFTAIRGT